MLSLGASKPWKEAMETLTGETEMNPDALIEYFKPLMDWIREDNKKNNVKVGWSVDNFEDLCSASKSDQR